MKKESTFMGRIVIKKTICFPLLLFMLFSGCVSYYPCGFKSKQTMVKLTNSFGYKKKIVILPAVNSSYIEGIRLDTVAESNFTDQIISKNPDVLLVDSNALTSLISSSLNDDDVVGDYELIDLGRSLGLTAIVLLNIRDISINKCNIGSLWFKRNKEVLKVRVTATVVDVLTGAILGRYTKEIKDIKFNKIVVSKILSFKESTGPIMELNETFLKVTNELGSLVGAAILKQQWTTTITAIKDNRIIVQAGAAAGVSVGDRFAVFCNKSTVNDSDNHIYFIPGNNIGYVAITDIDDEVSYGVFTGSEAPFVGSILIPIIE